MVRLVFAIVMGLAASAHAFPPPTRIVPPAPPQAPVPEESPARLLPTDAPYPPLAESAALRRPIQWEGQRFSTLDWILTGAAAAATVASVIIEPRREGWRGGRLFDERSRDFLRLGSEAARFGARDASDVLLSLEVTWPFFVDALILTWWYHGSPDAAAELSLINAKSLAIVTAVHGATTILASRERPYARACGTEVPAESNECESADLRYRAFFSGHAATSFLGASLTCVHHVKLRLFGGGRPEVLTCAVAYAAATTTALLRTMADVHYTTDVLAGAAVGTLVGIGIPLLHHRKARRPPDVTLVPFGAGLGVAGTFR